MQISRFQILFAVTLLTFAGSAAFSAAANPDPALVSAVGSPARSATAVARDPARHPVEELTFFGLAPTMTVVELWPGGGYWTDILGPYLAAKGHYYIALPAAGNAEEDEGVTSNNEDVGVLNGVAVDDLDQATRREMNLPAHVKGAVITNVAPDSAAARSGLSAGDVILEINKQPVTSAKDAVDLSASAQGKKTLLKLWSHGSTIFAVVDESGAEKANS